MAFEKQRKTFLSYSRVNKDFALRLAKELKSEGFDIWLDQLDIPAGSRWDREVERALKESEIFMIILTPASVDSENVLDEIGYAIDNGKRFLPVLLENCEVPLRLRRFQYVDFTNKDFDDGVESAKDLLRDLIMQVTIPRGATSSGQQAETDRKAKEDAEQIARQKAEADRQAKEEDDRKAKKEDDHLAKAEADRNAKQKTDADRKAKQDTDREAREEADRLAKQKATPSAIPSASKQPISQGMIYGIGAVAVIVILGVVFSVISNGGNKNESISTPTSAVTLVAKETAVATLNLTPAEIMRPIIVPTQTKTEVSVQEKFFTLKFDQNADLSNFEFFNDGKGDEKNMNINPLENGIEFVLNDQYLSPIYFYAPYSYDDVAVRLQAENLGSDNNFNVGLVCRFTGKVWYEVSITGGGLWEIFWWYKDGGGGYFKDGGTNALKVGQWVNDYEMRCIGNKISLYINGQEVKTIETTTYTQYLSEQEKNSVAEGQVGFSISSEDSTPVDVLVSEFEVYKP